MVSLSMIGISLDTYTYYDNYIVEHIYLQYFCIAVSFASLILVIINIERFYKIAYLLTVYSVILTLLSTSFFYNYFNFDEPVNQSFIGLRDTYYMIIFTAISGFIIDKRHIIIQGILLNILILYYTFYLKDSFFLENIFVNIFTSIGFIIMCYFLVRTITRLNEGLNQTIIETQKRHELSQLRTTKLSIYQGAMVKLIKANTLHIYDLESLYYNICKIAAECMGVNRVSIWAFESDNTVLVRKTLYANSELNEEVMVIREADNPLYFHSLQNKFFIKADNVYTNQDTKAFTSTYLEPLNICSMLDCLFRLDGEPAGVICCETQEKFMNWTMEDVLFVQSLADYAAIAHKNQQIKQLLEEIRSKNISLESQIGENRLMNDELNALNEELMSVNEGLEKTVMERTSILQDQNEQLAEYAFINSHLLRAPIARILGLANIITKEVKLDKDKHMLEALHITTQELDEIVRKIGDILYEERPMSRADVKEMISRNMSNNN
ncbi:hypothetical protein GCM10011506_03140 [Marivirga lumbricoides]|uniref:GAF domain-containing protein n=1 Tax=Marivirga lumbricoides TaxID=1046115 RepID=A0ABQ1L9T1_9BACT|nr:hypothetical protein GCM10011506_03140 [Marivirga lumbricoides]